mmetsp:Transcript_21938/g.65793  ORF Transcript_21938/g.65793 Transcript_21938/m.65793 type:complete len:239 (-) Transcript_21938:302-1018(-)
MAAPLQTASRPKKLDTPRHPFRNARRGGCSVTRGPWWQTWSASSPTLVQPPSTPQASMYRSPWPSTRANVAQPSARWIAMPASCGRPSARSAGENCCTGTPRSARGTIASQPSWSACHLSARARSHLSSAPSPLTSAWPVHRAHGSGSPGGARPTPITCSETTRQSTKARPSETTNPPPATLRGRGVRGKRDARLGRGPDARNAHAAAATTRLAARRLPASQNGLSSHRPWFPFLVSQ